MPDNQIKKDFYLNPLVMPSDTVIQDTTRNDTILPQKDTAETSRDTVREEMQLIRESRKELDIEKIDSLLKANEQKEQEFRQKKLQQTQVPQKPEQEVIDTPSTLYEIFGVTEMPISDKLENDPSTINFLYNIPSYAPKDTLKSKGEIFQSYRTEQKIQPKSVEEKKNFFSENGYDWLFYFLIGIFLLIGWTRLFYKKYFDMLLKSIFFYNYAQNLYDVKNSLTTRASSILNLVYYLATGLFVFQIFKHFDIQIMGNIPPILQFLMFSLFFAVWYLWNSIFTGFTGSVFLRRDAFNEYFLNYNIYRKVLGLALFTLVIITQFIAIELKAPFIYAGIILFGIMYLAHILRGLQTFVKNNVSIFYLILYLCALEFLPLLVLYERFIGNL